MKEETRILEKLIPLSLQLIELEPWRWMFEFELFGVIPPGSEAPYFASVMGSAGQFPAVSFYEGNSAADQFLFIQETEIGSLPDDILLIPHLTVSFEQTGQMQPDDRNRIKISGFQLKHKKRWPVFRQNVPGHPHVFPEPQKLRDLLTLLEQTLYVAECARKKREELNFIVRTLDGVRGMFRTADPQTNTWRTENRTLRTNYVAADIRFSAQLVAELKEIPRQDLVLEADLSLLPTPVQDRDPEYFPFAFLLIDHHSGYIVHCRVLSPHPSVDEMFAGCGQRLLEALTGQNIRPRQIHVRSWRLHSVFKKVLSGTPVHLSLKPELPALDEARESLLKFLS